MCIPDILPTTTLGIGVARITAATRSGSPNGVTQTGKKADGPARMPISIPGIPGPTGNSHPVKPCGGSCSYMLTSTAFTTHSDLFLPTNTDFETRSPGLSGPANIVVERIRQFKPLQGVLYQSPKSSCKLQCRWNGCVFGENDAKIYPIPWESNPI